ncbi:MAG: hypothetical protein ACYTJ0_08750 [Planctomycetota bacterium]|jgi:hypothetical protein
MCALQKLCAAVYWIALAIWFGALVAAAVAAMNVFGTLPEMPMRLEAYALYPAAEHGRIAAGQVMANVFLTVDLLQYGAAPIALAMLAMQLVVFRSIGRRWASFVRTIAMVASALLLAWYAVALAPEMGELLRAYWQAARAGDAGRAEELLTAFDRLHVRADAVYRAELLMLLVTIAASACAAITAPPPRCGLDQPDLAPSP